MGAAWLLVFASLPLAAPAPRVRSEPVPKSAGGTSLGAVRADGPARGVEAICGTRLEASAEIVTAHAARTLQSPLPTPHSTDAGEIAVLEDDGTFFYQDKGGHVIADLAAIGQSFYRTHGDDYDCLAVFLASGLSTWLGSPTAIAAAFVLRNSIQGIGVDAFDFGSNMGSASRLQWMLSLNGLDRYPADPYADISGDSFTTLDVISHEFAHRWLAYSWIDSAGTPSSALLGRARQHWSFFFDADSSFMEGGDWQPVAPDSFRIDGVSGAFGNLDLYLMGLRDKAATPPFFTLHDATNFDPPGTYNPTSFPTVGMTCRARQHFWSVDDLEAQNGPRVPDAASAPHGFRVGFVLVVPRGQDATSADLAEVENLRQLFPPWFAASTQGLGTIDATIDSRAGTVAIHHVPLKDRLDLATPATVSARVAIDPGGIPIAVDPGSVRVFWRLGTAGAFQPAPMAAMGGDLYEGQIPPSPGYEGPVQYYLYAASDSAGIDATEPAAGAVAPHAFDVGPDLEPPAIVHVPILAQGAAQLPVTLLARVADNMAVDSVWVRWGAGALTTAAPMTAAGGDSFTIAIGAGAPEGAQLVYEIHARDVNGLESVHQAPGGAPWTLAVERDWTSDFENGVGGWPHAPYWYSYRDAWHPTTETPSPAGGTTWKCGDDAPLPYPVHLDANLYLPPLASVDPGTTLRFDHRWELEEASATYAWDGARIEGQVNDGPWIPLTPGTPYSHVFYLDSNPFQKNTPCWSGSSGGWRSETVDLSPLAPGPARVRFRMLADDFVGYDGWLVDHVRVDFPGGSVGVPVAPAALVRAPWPNPATDALQVQLQLPRAGRVEWALFDLAGRRVATLASRDVVAGAAPLEARLPRGLRPGVYLSRLAAPGIPARTDRIAVVR